MVAGRESINISLLRSCTEYDEDVNPGAWFGLVRARNIFLIQHGVPPWRQMMTSSSTFGRLWRILTTLSALSFCDLFGPGRACLPQRKNSHKSLKYSLPAVLGQLPILTSTSRSSLLVLYLNSTAHCYLLFVQVSSESTYVLFQSVPAKIQFPSRTSRKVRVRCQQNDPATQSTQG